MAETLMEKLTRLRAERQEFTDTILARIAEIEKDKEEMIAAYDDEILGLRDELDIAGIPSVKVGCSRNQQLAQDIYALLSNNPGQLFSGFEINRRMKSAATMTIVLAEYLDAGKIERVGKSYRVPTPEPQNERTT